MKPLSIHEFTHSDVKFRYTNTTGSYTIVNPVMIKFETPANIYRNHRLHVSDKTSKPISDHISVQFMQNHGDDKDFNVDMIFSMGSYTHFTNKTGLEIAFAKLPRSRALWTIVMTVTGVTFRSGLITIVARLLECRIKTHLYDSYIPREPFNVKNVRFGHGGYIFFPDRRHMIITLTDHVTLLESRNSQKKKRHHFLLLDGKEWETIQLQIYSKFLGGITVFRRRIIRKIRINRGIIDDFSAYTGVYKAKLNICIRRCFTVGDEVILTAIVTDFNVEPTTMM